VEHRCGSNLSGAIQAGSFWTVLDGPGWRHHLWRNYRDQSGRQYQWRTATLLSNRDCRVSQPVPPNPKGCQIVAGAKVPGAAPGSRPQSSMTPKGGGRVFLTKGCCESGKTGARMPTSARTLLGFFGQFADVGIRAPEPKGLLQQALTKSSSLTYRGKTCEACTIHL